LEKEQAKSTETGREQGMRFKSLSGQLAFEQDGSEHRVMALVARRQYGKTTGTARIALKKMMRQKGHTVLFGSVKLDLGREMVRKEAEQVQRAFAMLAEKDLTTETQRAQRFTGRDTFDRLIARACDNKRRRTSQPRKGFGVNSLVPTKGSLKLADGENGKLLPDNLKPEDFATLYEALRLEFRYYHSQGAYSRTKVVALTPEAVGETGDLIVDEFERVKRAREVWEAVEPFISRNPEYRCLFTLTPPEDDRHPSFEMFAPPAGLELPVRPEGNLYRSEGGFWVRRVTAFDAYEDGVPMYDTDSGGEITPEAARTAARDKAAWDRNYGCKFLVGGSAAVDLMCLSAAQQRGVGRCACVYCESDADFQTALDWLRDHLTPGLATAIGYDPATTEKKESNPSSLTVTQQSGNEFISPLTVLWKTRDPRLARERLRSVVDCCAAKGAAVRRVCMDATSERLFAEETRQEFGGRAPVVLVIAGETVTPHPPGYDTSRGGVNYKTWTADSYCGAINENHYALPPEHYLKKSHRLVIKSGGRYECEVDTDGDHGDTFDSGRLAQYGLMSTGGGIRSVADLAMGMAGPSSAGGEGYHLTERVTLKGGFTAY